MKRKMGLGLQSPSMSSRVYGGEQPPTNLVLRCVHEEERGVLLLNGRSHLETDISKG